MHILNLIALYKNAIVLNKSSLIFLREERKANKIDTFPNFQTFPLHISILSAMLPRQCKDK